MILKPKSLTVTILLWALHCSISAQLSPQLLLAEGQYNAVIKQFEPNSHQLSFPDSYYLALAYQQLGFPDKAIHCLTNTTATLNSQQLDLLCRCYLSTGNYTKALPIIKDTYQQDPLNTVNLLRYAEVNHFYKEYKANIDLLKEYTRQDSGNYNINLFLAESYERTKQTSHAIATYLMILQAHPNNQKVALKLANLYYGDKQYVECHDLCMPYIERLENNKNFLLIAGMANFKNGSNHNVIAMFKRLEAQGDSSFLTKKHLGIASYRLENFNNATNYLKAAIKLKDDDPEVAFFLGASLGQSSQPLDGKIFLLIAQELIKPSPALMEKTNLKLAMMHFDTGHYQMAIEYYNKAYVYAPSNHQYLYRQASIYDYQLKNAAKAKELYRQFIDALPDDLNPKKGNELYAIKLKKVASNRLNNLIEEDFFKNGIN